MGNNVSTTAVETVKIDNEDSDDTFCHNNKINGTVRNDHLQFDQKGTFQSDSAKPEWSYYDNQEYMGVFDDSSINERINGNTLTTGHSNKPEQLNTVQEYNDEISDVVSDMKDQTILNEINARRTPLIRSQTLAKEGLPLLVRSTDGNDDDIKEIDDLISIESGSKLTLNDMKSDTDEVIQELNKLISETDDKELFKNSHFRRRGQSWSNWDNNVNVELKAESSMSSFSRPTSNIDKDVKPKSFTAPETRGQIDSAIEWLAKQHGLDLGSSLDYDRHKPVDSSNSKNTLRISSMEIPGTISSTPSTPVSNDNELQVKYDDLDKQIINSIENDFIR